VGDQRAYVDHPAFEPDLVEAIDAGYVDENAEVRPYSPLHLEKEIGASGQDPGIGTVVGE
jgi:hypothetical protein